jgi:hypothetical protein
MVHDRKRFKVAHSGRRSGKTERSMRLIAKAVMRGGKYFVGAPTRPQAEQIFWEHLKLLTFALALGRDTYSEADLEIRLNPKDSEQLLRVGGLDEPQRIEGINWDGMVIDEIASLKRDAWPKHLKPALDTVDPRRPDYRAWAILIGVPEGHNFWYHLCEYARTSGDPEWGYYHWPSWDILPPDVIESARHAPGMTEEIFEQEYGGKFVTMRGRIYKDYCDENLTQETLQPHEQLLWCHDFNYSPLSSAVCVVRNRAELLVLGEIVLTSAVARQSALEFADRYRSHGNRHVVIYGDPAGRAGEKHGHASDYTELEGILKDAGWQVTRCVKAKAPAIRDRQNAVRAKIKNAAGTRSLFVNAALAPTGHKGLSITQLKEGSSFLEAESDYQHITTAIGYLCDYLWPVQSVRAAVDLKEVQTPTVHHWSQQRL